MAQVKKFENKGQIIGTIQEEGNNGASFDIDKLFGALQPRLLDGLQSLFKGRVIPTSITTVASTSSKWYKPGSSLEYPLHGSGAIVDALVRGIRKFGGRLALGTHVDGIIVENGRAVGVQLSSGLSVRARKAVVSNASMWDTLNLLPAESVPSSYRDKVNKTQQCESFLHLHLGFDAKDIPEDLEIHHIVVNDWNRGVHADQNVVLISIPSVLGKELAPTGKHVLHAYTPGTEPYDIWEGLDRRSSEYKKLKAERSEVMWQAVERVLGPGFDRNKCEVKLVGTPLTHQRFLRRKRGTYGPAIRGRISRAFNTTSTSFLLR